MAGRPSKPVQLIKLEGNKDRRTKAELEHREKIEKALFTGTSFKESPAVKSDPIAHKEFLRLKKLYKKIEYIDGLDEQIINDYCLIVSQENMIMEMIANSESNQEKLKLIKEVNRTVKLKTQLGNLLFLSPTARVRAIPKTPPEENKKSKMSSFLNKRGVGNGS